MTNSRRKGKVGEEWRPVKGFEEIYEVSDLGRIRRIKVGKGKTPHIMTNSYRGAHGNLRLWRECKSSRCFGVEGAVLAETGSSRLYRREYVHITQSLSLKENLRKEMQKHYGDKLKA